MKENKIFTLIISTSPDLYFGLSISDLTSIVGIIASFIIGWLLWNISRQQLELERKREKPFPCFDFSYSIPAVDIKPKLPKDNLETLAFINFTISIVNNGKGALFDYYVKLEHKNVVFESQDVLNYIIANKTIDNTIGYAGNYSRSIIQPQQKVTLLEISVPFLKPESTQVIGFGKDIPESQFIWDLIENGNFSIHGKDINGNNIDIVENSSLTSDHIISAHPIIVKH